MDSFNAQETPSKGLLVLAGLADIIAAYMRPFVPLLRKMDALRLLQAQVSRALEPNFRKGGEWDLDFLVEMLLR